MENQRYSGENFDSLEAVDLPNSTAVLVLGIGSLVGLLCSGIPGLIMAIIALVLASGDKRRYLLNPAHYRKGSVSNMRAGKICAIISICLLVLIVVLVIFVVVGLGVAGLKGWIPFNQ